MSAPLSDLLSAKTIPEATRPGPIQDFPCFSADSFGAPPSWRTLDYPDDNVYDIKAWTESAGYFGHQLLMDR